MSEKIIEAISNRLSALVAESGKNNSNKDRKYMARILLIAVRYLYSIGVYTFPEIIKIFQINHFNGANFFSNVILEITKRIKKEPQFQYDIEWIKSRAVSKGNNNDKKIILCFLLYTYQDSFITYLRDYLLENKHNNEENIRNLISALEKLIKEAPKNSTQEKNVETNQKNENEIINKKESLNEDYIINLETDQNNENENIIPNKSLDEDNIIILEKDQMELSNQINLIDEYSYDDSVPFGVYQDDYFELQDNSDYENIYW